MSALTSSSALAFTNLNRCQQQILLTSRIDACIISRRSRGLQSKDLQVKNLKRVLECSALIHDGIGIDEDYRPRRDLDHAESTTDEVNRTIRDLRHEGLVQHVKELLGTMDDGRITVSAYDTAWIAMVQNVDGSDSPQFPTAVSWIAKNQLPDGSWGEEALFCAYDRLLNTLACVIALKTWNLHPDKCDKGIQFINENMFTLENEDVEDMNVGFEINFPALVDRARNMGIDVSCVDTAGMKELYKLRDAKMKKVPRDLLHSVSNVLLHNLEGLQDVGLEWDKLLKLKSSDGSYVTSPSATAFAYMETKDENCLSYLNYVASKFNGAPTVYPVDTFARLFGVDRIDRLGISRYFRSEIEECLTHIRRVWTKNGIFSGRNCDFCDIDDTSMGFRFLRQHGYEMDPNVFKYFKRGDVFCCYPGQLAEAPSAMFNFYRGTQVLYPGETILEEARAFARNYLENWLAGDNHKDKWIIAKNLAGEIKYALEMPWYANLPRIETRNFIEMYGAGNDVWIGKSLYRMPEISSDEYLELAKLDYDKCQAQHQKEWIDIREWYAKCNLEHSGMSSSGLLRAFFLAAASIFEQERSIERLAWTKSLVLSEIIKSYFKSTSVEQMRLFVNEFRNLVDGTMTRSRNDPILNSLLEFLHEISLDVLKVHGKDISQQLHNAWESWLLTIMENEPNGEEAELLVHTLNFSAGRVTSNDIVSGPEYFELSKLINNISCQLHEVKIKREALDSEEIGNVFQMPKEVDANMQLIVQRVFQKSSIPQDVKLTFFTVAKTFYYSAHCAPETIDAHISQVLFQPVSLF